MERSMGVPNERPSTNVRPRDRVRRIGNSTVDGIVGTVKSTRLRGEQRGDRVIRSITAIRDRSSPRNLDGRFR